MRIAVVLALCAVGALAAFQLLRPSSDDEPSRPPLRAVAFDPSALRAALAARADALRAAQAVGGGRLDELLAQDPLDLAIPQVTQQGVTLRDVAVRRRGGEAAAEATVDLAQLAAVAPVEVSDLDYDAGASRPGELVVRGEAEAFGVSVPVTVRVVVRDGALVAEPDGVPVGDTVLFDDPRVRITGLRGTEVDGGLRIRVTADVG